MESKSWHLIIAGKEYPCEQQGVSTRLGFMLLINYSFGQKKVIGVHVSGEEDYNKALAGIPVESICKGSRPSVKCHYVFK